MLAGSNRKFQWINLIWFQLVWLTAVYFTSQAQFYLLLSLCCHFYLTPSRHHDLRMMASIILVGASFDAILSLEGVMRFADDVLLPLWLLLLWAHFALALNHGMYWLNRLPVYLQALFGGVFGPLSYYLGYKMGAVSFPLPMPATLSVLAVIWFCLLPVYLIATRYLRGNSYENRHGN